MADPLYRALLIGNSIFERDPHNLATLTGPANDLLLLRAALSHPIFGLFSPANIRPVLDGTYAQILTALATFLSEAGPNDHLLIYYSGHGYPDLNNNLYLCARDTNTSLLAATALSDKQINMMVESSRARRFFFFLDCCHSGAFKGAASYSLLGEGSGRNLMASCASDQLSADAEASSGASVFTHFLAQALTRSDLDADADGMVTASDLYSYIRPRVFEKNGQTVQWTMDRTFGEAPLARSRPVAKTVAPRITSSETREHGVPAGTASARGSTVPPLPPPPSAQIVSDAWNTVYPAALRMAEAAALMQRRSLAGLDPATPQVGLALTGSGTRAIAFGLGVLQAMAQAKLFRRIDYIASVGGGSHLATFVGGAFCRANATPDSVEQEISDPRSWSARWLRDHGRLRPGQPDESPGWVFLNWALLQVAWMSVACFCLGFAALLRADLWTGRYAAPQWSALEDFLWSSTVYGIWLSPWIVLPPSIFALIILPAGVVFAVTGPSSAQQIFVRRLGGVVHRVAHRALALGFTGFVVTLAFGLGDSIGQTFYLFWSMSDFGFPSLLSLLLVSGMVFFSLFARRTAAGFADARRSGYWKGASAGVIVVSITWVALILISLGGLVHGMSWRFSPIWDGQTFNRATGGITLIALTLGSLFLMVISGRLSGMLRQTPGIRGAVERMRHGAFAASNPARRSPDRTGDLQTDDLAWAAYSPARTGGPLHLLVTSIAETGRSTSGQDALTHQGRPFALGTFGASVGAGIHLPFRSGTETAEASRVASAATVVPPEIDRLSVAQWAAISGAARPGYLRVRHFMAVRCLELLGNLRSAIWWDAGDSMPTSESRRLLRRIWPRPFFVVQHCLSCEIRSRFSGIDGRYWNITDGRATDPTGCYELIRRRLPLIILCDGGSDSEREFADVEELALRVRRDLNAELTLVDEPAVGSGLGRSSSAAPWLDELVHPALIGVIGSEENSPGKASATAIGGQNLKLKRTPAHAFIARIRFRDSNQFSWILGLRAAVTGDEPVEIVDYFAARGVRFRSAPRDDDEDQEQWDIFRKLGEHVGKQLFTPPENAAIGWSPSEFTPPRPQSGQ